MERNRRRIFRLVLALASLGMGACGSVQFRVGDGASPKQKSARTEPASQKNPASQKLKKDDPEKEEKAILDALQYIDTQKTSYEISPSDLIEVTVYQEKDLNRKVRVSPDGSITLPLVGRVLVGGLSVAAAERAVHDKLKKFVVNPHVSVFIAEYGNKQVYVLGQVKKPGSYPLPTEAPLTVIEAISLAGGFTEYASMDRTRVIRKTADTSKSFIIDITAIMKKGDKSKDIELITNDVIFVPESFF